MSDSPDTFDLDRAFDDLTRDVLSSTTPRGAGRAISASRRRRAAGAGIAAAAVLTAGGVALSSLGGDHVERVPVAPDTPVEIIPAPLSAAVLGEATSPWLGPWTEGNSTPLTDNACVDAGGTEPVTTGVVEFRDGPRFGASRVYAQWRSPAQSDRIAARIHDGLITCQEGAMTPTTLDAGDVRVTSYAFPDGMESGGMTWMAVADDRIGLLTIVGTDVAPSADVQQEVAEALAAGLTYDEPDD